MPKKKMTALCVNWSEDLFYLFMCCDVSFQVISFFSSRLEQAGAELSVERVLEIIKQGAVALPKDRLRVSAQDLIT